MYCPERVGSVLLTIHGQLTITNPVKRELINSSNEETRLEAAHERVVDVLSDVLIAADRAYGFNVARLLELAEANWSEECGAEEPEAPEMPEMSEE